MDKSDYFKKRLINHLPQGDSNLYFKTHFACTNIQFARGYGKGAYGKGLINSNVQYTSTKFCVFGPIRNIKH